MSDEQTIYISPEDDLTTVRERLEHIPSRRVTLVVPAQTQLRSHVAWKLLYARARELGKDVSIVSSDPQVRSVAHAVKFKVAHSLETTQQGHIHSNIRPASRPTRTHLNKNTRAASPSQRSTTTRGPRSTNALRSQQQEATRAQPANSQSADLNNENIREEPASSTFQVPERPSQRPYPYEPEDYHYKTTPSIHPLTPGQIDDDPDMLAEDYKQASDIRRAASRPGLPSDNEDVPGTPFPLDADEHKNDLGTLQVPRTDIPQSRHEPSGIIDLNDDEINDDDILTPSLPEQQGHAFVEGFDIDEHQAEKTTRHRSHIEDIEDVDDIPDIANYPTSIIEPHTSYIDEDDVRPPQSPSSSEQDKKRTSKSLTKQKQPVRDTHNRRARTGYISPGKASAPNSWQEAQENEDLLPVEEHDEMAYERPSHVGKEPRPVQLPIDSIEPFSEAREPRAQSQLAAHRGASQRQNMGTTSKRGTGTLTRSRRPQPAPVSTSLQAPPPPWSTPGTPQRKTRPGSVKRAALKARSRGLQVGLGIVALLVILLLVLGYFIPTSTVTIALTTHTYNRPFTVTATSATATGAGNTIQARTIKQDFMRQNVEPVTGSKMVDSGLAQGNVCFSNSGNNPITVPTGTIIEATGPNGTQFKVIAESVILPKTTCDSGLAPDPIQAVQPGESGNLQAGTISVIPTSSLESIAQVNSTTVDKLSGLKVTNPQSTQGGGRQQVNAVSNADLQNAQNTLYKQLQGDIDAWLKSLPNNGVMGKPTTSNTLVNPPAVGTTPTNNAKSFQATIKVSVSILLVSNDDLKQFAIPQINNTLQNDKNLRNYVVPNNSLQAVQINNANVQNSTSTQMQISYTASAQVVNNISPDQVQQLRGHTIADAQHTIKSQISGVQNVNITTNPAFFPWVAFWPSHIDVKTRPVLPSH